MLCYLNRKNDSSNLMLVIVIVNRIHKMVMVAFVIDHILITFIIILGN